MHTLSRRRALFPVLVAAIATLFVFLTAMPNAGAARPTSTSSTIPPTTTTTAPPSKPPGTTAVGYIGCSVTESSVRGYHTVGGKRLWPYIGQYDGGTVFRWASFDTYKTTELWASFDASLAAHPTTAIWWMLCRRDVDTGDSYQAALTVLAKIKARIPTAVVYVTPQPAYVPADLCYKSGPAGPIEMAALAQKLVAEGRAKAAVNLSPFTLASTKDPYHCSPTYPGEALIGNQIKAWLG